MSGHRLTPRQAAARLGVSTKTLLRWESSGRLHPERSPGGQRRYPLEEIEALAGAGEHLRELPDASTSDGPRLVDKLHVPARRHRGRPLRDRSERSDRSEPLLRDADGVPVRDPWGQTIPLAMVACSAWAHVYARIGLPAPAPGTTTNPFPGPDCETCNPGGLWPDARQAEQRHLARAAAAEAQMRSGIACERLERAHLHAEVAARARERLRRGQMTAAEEAAHLADAERRMDAVVSDIKRMRRRDERRDERRIGQALELTAAAAGVRLPSADVDDDEPGQRRTRHV